MISEKIKPQEESCHVLGFNFTKEFLLEIRAFQISCHSGYEILIQWHGQLRFRLNQICWLAETGGGLLPYFWFPSQTGSFLTNYDSHLLCKLWKLQVGEENPWPLIELTIWSVRSPWFTSVSCLWGMVEFYIKPIYKPLQVILAFILHCDIISSSII